MFVWILFVASFIALVFLFIRKLLLTQKDLVFQDTLAEEEAEKIAESEKAELAAKAEEMENAPEDQAPVKTKGMRKTFMKADTHFSRGEFDEAEPLFITVVESDNEHLEAHHKLGMLYLKKEDFPQAELYFSKLVNMKKDPIYFSNLGAALYQQQRLVEAAEAYENAIALDNRRAARLQSLAQVYFELGDDDKALKYFELAARKKPKDVALKMLIAEYYERLERHEEAAVMLENILEKDPYNKEAKVMLKGLSL